MFVPDLVVRCAFFRVLGHLEHDRTHVLTMQAQSVLTQPIPVREKRVPTLDRPRAHQSGSALRLVPPRPSPRGPRLRRPAGAKTPPPPCAPTRPSLACCARRTGAASGHFAGPRAPT